MATGFLSSKSCIAVSAAYISDLLSEYMSSTFLPSTVGYILCASSIPSISRAALLLSSPLVGSNTPILTILVLPSSPVMNSVLKLSNVVQPVNAISAVAVTIHISFLKCVYFIDFSFAYKMIILFLQLKVKA